MDKYFENVSIVACMFEVIQKAVLKKKVMMIIQSLNSCGRKAEGRGGVIVFWSTNEIPQSRFLGKRQLIIPTATLDFQAC